MKEFYRETYINFLGEHYSVFQRDGPGHAPTPDELHPRGSLAEEGVAHSCSPHSAN